MIPIMPDAEFQKLSEEEQNAQWNRELDAMTEEDWDRFYFNCTGRHLGDPIPPEELVGHGRILRESRRFSITLAEISPENRNRVGGDLESKNPFIFSPFSSIYFLVTGVLRNGDGDWPCWSYSHDRKRAGAR